MHLIDANETQREKARLEPHKNAVYCLEQVLEAIPNKTAAVQPLASHLTKHDMRRIASEAKINS